MRFMMLVIPKDYEKAAPDAAPDAKDVERMMKYNEELAKAGVLLSLDGLKPPSAGVRVSFAGGTPKVTDGPFAEGVRGRLLDDPGEIEAGSHRVGQARADAGWRDHRGAPGAGDRGFPGGRAGCSGRLRGHSREKIRLHRFQKFQQFQRLGSNGLQRFEYPCNPT
jgi:hypothetical protein